MKISATVPASAMQQQEKYFFQVKSGIDVGRCMAADIDPTNPGVEMWSWESKGLRNIKGEVVNPDIKTFSVNMAVWWDGDLLRELLNKNDGIQVRLGSPASANRSSHSKVLYRTTEPKQLPACKAIFWVTGAKKYYYAQKTIRHYASMCHP